MWVCRNVPLMRAVSVDTDGNELVLMRATGNLKSPGSTSYCEHATCSILGSSLAPLHSKTLLRGRQSQRRSLFISSISLTSLHVSVRAGHLQVNTIGLHGPKHVVT
jgi:hypothetical protein